MGRIGIILLFLVSIVLSCAVPVPPSGGPADKTPPQIISTVPSEGSSGVNVDSQISFEFSEKMAKNKVERLFVSYPRMEIGGADWSGNSLTIRPGELLVSDTTYVISLKKGFRDAHNVKSESSYRLAFATGTHIDSGFIEGIVKFRRRPSSSAVVRCFLLPKDSSFAPASARPDREAETDDKGVFRFVRLPTNNASFIVWGFMDANGNADFEKGKEFGNVHPDTILLSTNAYSSSGLVIDIIDPTEPGTISGSIRNETGGDSLPVSVGLYSFSDSIEAVSYYNYCDKAGSFKFMRIESGQYRLKAFIDILRDSICGYYKCFQDTSKMCREPCVEYPDSINLDPGGNILLKTLILKKD